MTSQFNPNNPEPYLKSKRRKRNNPRFNLVSDNQHGYFYTVDVDTEVMNWILETQPVFMWKYDNDVSGGYLHMQRIMMLPKLYTLIGLMWT